MIDQVNQTEEIEEIEKPEPNNYREVFNNQSISENLLPNCQNDSANCTEEGDTGGYFYKVCCPMVISFINSWMIIFSV